MQGQRIYHHLHLKMGLMAAHQGEYSEGPCSRHCAWHENGCAAVWLVTGQRPPDLPVLPMGAAVQLGSQPVPTNLFPPPPAAPQHADFNHHSRQDRPLLRCIGFCFARSRPCGICVNSTDLFAKHDMTYKQIITLPFLAFPLHHSANVPRVLFTFPPRLKGKENMISVISPVSHTHGSTL